MSRKQRSRRQSPKRLLVETLEQRCLLDAQMGGMMDLAASDPGSTSPGQLLPAPIQTDAPEISRFGSAAELGDFLVRDANKRYGDLFGKEAWYPPWPIPLMEGDVDMMAATNDVRTDVADFSETNIQVAGVDEGDIVKTDGRYLYLSGDRNVTIVDAAVPSDLSVASRVEIDGHAVAMYLSEDRLTVISTVYRGGIHPMPMMEVAPMDVAIWPPPEPWEPETMFTVFDVSSPGNPRLVEQIDVEGMYSDSRMIDQTVYVVSSGSFYLPPPQIVPGPPADGQPPENLAADANLPTVSKAGLWLPERIEPPGQHYFYETADQYWARIGNRILELALPNYTSYGPDGQELDSDWLSQPENVYKPLSPSHDRLVSVTAIDVSADPAIVDSASAPIDWTSEVYVSPENLYLVSPQFLPGFEDGGGSSIYRFRLDTQADGIRLVATGHVPGSVLDQFSMDEYDGYLRIVTQRGWGPTARSDLFVLQQDGDRLEVVGSVEELAAGERLFSVRFVDQLAFVVTFGPTGGGWFDPLFTVDLSDPAKPEVRGELEIPGFSNYLQRIDGDYLIGLGRNADETSGRSLEPQISLYDVHDLDHPQLADRLSFAQGGMAWSEAFTDHHAISYFPEYGVLAIPLNTYGPKRDVLGQLAAGEGSDSLDVPRLQHQSALWVFQIDVSADTEKIELLGQIEHESYVRRSIRIGDVLFSISDDTVQAHQILDPDTQLGEIYYGRSARDDYFTVDRNSVDNALDVLANDAAAPDDGRWPIITAVGESAKGGEVQIADDGRSLLYTPADGFAAVDSFTYTIDNGPRGEDSATVTVRVQWAVDEDSVGNVLDVLAWLDLPYDGPAKITAVEAGHPESEVAVAEDGQSLIYSPAPDLAGWDWLRLTVAYEGQEPPTQHHLTVRVKGVNDNPTAEDDHFVVPADGPEQVLPVLKNDTALPDFGERLTITEVGPTTGGGTVAIGPEGRHLVYEPGGTDALEDSFTYTISDGNGGTDEATVTIELVRPHDLVRMRVEAVDGSGEVIKAVEAGDEFYLNVYVQDLREQPQGVYSAYVDLMFFGRRASVAGEISFGEEYENGQSGDASHPGLVDELGAFAGKDPVGNGEVLLASIPFTARRPGPARFVLTPADEPGSEVLLYGESGAVPPIRIAYTGTKIEVVRGWRNAVKPSDVNGDGQTTPLDVLALIQDLNDRGSRHLGRHEDAAGETLAAERYLDVNGDGDLSPVDALIIVGELNAAAFHAAATDGNALDKPIPPLAELVDWAALKDILHNHQWTAPLETLDISPNEALDVAYQYLVAADAGAQVEGVPAEWSDGDVAILLQQWIENHSDGLPADELTAAADDLDALIDGLDLDAILPAMDHDMDRPQLHETFRDRLFAGFAAEILGDE